MRPQNINIGISGSAALIQKVALSSGDTFKRDLSQIRETRGRD